MMRIGPSGLRRGLARLLAGVGANDAGALEIANLGAPTMPSSAARLADVVEAAGGIVEYVVGPAFMGAKYQTIGAAIAAVQTDAHGAPVLVQIYPGTYTEDVVIPENVPQIILQGWGMNRQRGGLRIPGGTIIDGDLTVELASGGTFTECDSITVVGDTTITQASPPTPDPSNVMVNVDGCKFEGAFNLTSDRVLGGIEFSSLDSHFIGLQTVSARNVWMTGGSGQGGVLQAGSVSFIRGVRMEGNPASVLYTLSSDSSFFGVYACLEIWGRITFNGQTAVMMGCIQNYNGSPAVLDNATASTFVQGNVFTHNAGPDGPVWVKTTAGLFHPGCNGFTEGQEYPWYSVAGTTLDPSESDNQLRRLLEVAGTVVLTPAQVGAQRKTTVYKADGGGSVTLPEISTVEPGCTVLVVDGGNATASPWLVQGTGGELINGAANVPYAVNNMAREFQATETGWVIVSGYL